MAELVVKLVNGELAGKTAQSIAKEVNAAALALKKAEVGTQAWVDANKKLEDAKKLQADLKKQIESTAAASDMLKTAWNKLPGAQFFNQIADGFGLMKKGVGGLVTQFGALKTAIAATGIGLLVIALVTLVDWFKNTDEGGTLLSGVFKGLANITDKLFASIRSLADALKDPKKAMQDLGDFIVNNFMNRLKAFGVGMAGVNKLLKGDFMEGLKDITNAQIQFATGIENGIDKLAKFGEEIAKEVQEGIAFEQQLDAIEDRTRELNVAQAETEKVVSKLLLQSKNVSLSYDERIALLDRASAVELANHQAQLDNARAREKLMNEELAKKQAVGKATDDIDQQAKDATIARINLEQQSINLQEKIENRRVALLEKRQAEIEKQAAAELKIKQNIEDLKVQAMEDGADKEIEQINVDVDRKIQAILGSEEQIIEQEILLEEQRQVRIQEVKDRYAAEAAEKDKKAKEDQAKRDKQLADEQRKLLESKANFERIIQEQEQELALNAYQFGVDVLAKTIKNEKAARAARKLGALAEIAINLQREKSHNAIIAQEYASAFGPAAPVQFAAMLAKLNLLSNFRALLSAARVIVLKKGGFIGGLLKGPKHDDGGIPGIVRSTNQPLEMEGDEFVFSGKATRAIGAKTLSRVNDHYTRRMAVGGPINPFQDRSSVTGGVDTASLDIATIIEAQDRRLQEIIDAQDRRIDRIKVQNVVTETEDTLKIINKIRADADV